MYCRPVMEVVSGWLNIKKPQAGCSCRLSVISAFSICGSACVFVCVFSMNTESLRRSSVFTVAQYCKASAANLPRHRSAPQPLLQAFLIYLLDF